MSLDSFKSITNFVNELNKMFGNKHKSLKLYACLINKTTVSHDKSIQKHNEVFKRFCVSNKDAILQKNPSLVQDTMIKFSDKVFINMGVIFPLADADTLQSIWTHLLYIYALLDPSSDAKNM